MKILWYGQNPHYNSGMGRVGRELASYLSQYHDVHFFGQSVDGRPPEEKFGFTLYGNPFNDPTGDQMLNQYLSQIQPDALVTNLNYQQLQHVPQIVNSLRMQQNLDIPVFLHTAVETERAIPGFYEKVLGSYQTDAFLVPYNDAQVEMYKDSGDNRLLNSLTEPVPHGVDHNTYNPSAEQIGKQLLRERGIPDDAFTFLFVGENWRRKRIDKLCQAFAKVKEESDGDVRLVLHTSGGPSRGDDFFAGWNIASGPGQGADPVLDQYGLELGDDVHITKQHAAQFLPDNQMAGLYAASDAHILPTMGEGFGMTMLESMACGTPVIVTDLSTSRWLCEDAAEYIQPEGEELMRMGEVLKTPSADDMAEKMLKVYNDEGRRSEMVEKGLERAEEFSWRKSGRMFNEVLQDRV